MHRNAIQKLEMWCDEQLSIYSSLHGCARQQVSKLVININTAMTTTLTGRAESDPKQSELNSIPNK